MRSIGEMARASGLTVSALRFYDGAGVLVPAMVDTETGYRWYAERQIRPARLVASLRRVGMPLAGITQVLRHLGDPETVRRLLDAHLRQLEAGLADARRELSRVHILLDFEEHPMSDVTTRVTVSGVDLAAALASVRFAVSHDPALPSLCGVLFEIEAAELRLVATDRYRLAVSRTRVGEVSGAAMRVIAPTAFVDEVWALLVGVETVSLTLTPRADGGEILVEAAGQRVTGHGMASDFPDYRRLVGDQLGDPAGDRGARRVTVDVAAIRTALAPGTVPSVVREHDGVASAVAVLGVDPDGCLQIVGEEAWQADEAGHVAVNREFLLEALDAGGPGQLVLELDGPISPLAVRTPDDERAFSILMPIRR